MMACQAELHVYCWRENTADGQGVNPMCVLGVGGLLIIISIHMTGSVLSFQPVVNKRKPKQPVCSSMRISTHRVSALH